MTTKTSENRAEQGGGDAHALQPQLLESVLQAIDRLETGHVTLTQSMEKMGKELRDNVDARISQALNQEFQSALEKQQIQLGRALEAIVNECNTRVNKKLGATMERAVEVLRESLSREMDSQIQIVYKKLFREVEGRRMDALTWPRPAEARDVVEKREEVDEEMDTYFRWSIKEKVPRVAEVLEGDEDDPDDDIPRWSKFLEREQPRRGLK